MDSQSNYGLIIIGLSILTRIFIVSIAWNYGIFITAIKKTQSDTSYSEIGWIAGVAQGLGCVLCPVYIHLLSKLGAKITFFIGNFLCFISLLVSSFVPNEHYLFLTYSIPYGIGSSIIFVIGSLATGLYYPPNHKYHVTTSVLISLGFPLGFLFINPLNETLIEYYNNNWQKVQRIYSMIILIIMLISCPFFTTKYAKLTEDESKSKDEIVFKDEFLSIKSKHLKILVKIAWLIGIGLNSIANTSILTHLNGYLVSNGMDSSHLKTIFFLLGFADGIFRILLAILGPFIKKNLLFMFILASFIGFILSNLWADHINFIFNMIYYAMFGICPAVLMSLMYSVNSEIFGTYEIEKSYTTNVMVSGIGIIMGPFISGILLDNQIEKSSQNYDTVFRMAYRLYFLCLVCYSIAKFILLKYSIRVTKDSRESVQFSNYSELKNEF